MHVDRRQLFQALLSRGNLRGAEMARRELPDRVDTEAYAALLDSLGVTSGELDALVARSQETGGFGGFGGPGAQIRRLGG